MRWFIPHGVSVPAYVPPGRVSVAAGVDGLPGHCVGGIYQAGDWQKTAAGFWVLVDRPDASDCLRLHLPPHTVEIEHRSRCWCVPHLLTKRASGWESALPRIYTPEGWTDPYDCAAAQHRLRAALTAAADGTPPHEAEIAGLVGDLLGMTYHLSLIELAHAQWLDETLAGAVIAAAAGGA